MDGATRYRDAVEAILFRLDAQGTDSIDAQVSRLVREYVKIAAHCRLVLTASESGVAQSYRNYRSQGNSPTAWASRSVRADVEARLHRKLESTSDDMLRRVVSRWQDEQLRGKFGRDTPWSVIADWHAENGDLQKAEICRRLHEQATEYPG